jgi:hypothetical protein
MTEGIQELSTLPINLGSNIPSAVAIPTGVEAVSIVVDQSFNFSRGFCGAHGQEVLDRHHTRALGPVLGKVRLMGQAEGARKTELPSETRSQGPISVPSSGEERRVTAVKLDEEG